MASGNIIVQDNTQVEVVEVETHTEIITTEDVATQIEVLAVGPQGPKGDPGDVASEDMFFKVDLNFLELDTEHKKSAARVNLGVQIVDGGVFT